MRRVRERVDGRRVADVGCEAGWSGYRRSRRAACGTGGRGEGLFPPFSSVWQRSRQCRCLLPASRASHDPKSVDRRDGVLVRRASSAASSLRASRRKLSRQHVLETRHRLLRGERILPLGQLRVERDDASVGDSRAAQRTTKTGGVYLGVGPDQNFTYIVALKPKIAFIFDIRRQNMLTHLMYKALHRAVDGSRRLHLASLLTPATRRSRHDVDGRGDLHRRSRRRRPTALAFRKNITSIRDALTKHHGFKLSDEDLGTIAYVYESFVELRPDITYNYVGRARRRVRARHDAELRGAANRRRTATACTAATWRRKRTFRTLKEVEVNNLIVPIVGDFAGRRRFARWATTSRSTRRRSRRSICRTSSSICFSRRTTGGSSSRTSRCCRSTRSSTFIRSVFNGMGYNRGPGFGAYMRRADAGVDAGPGEGVQ